MSDTSIQPGGVTAPAPGLPQPNTYNPIAGASWTPGCPVSASQADDDTGIKGTAGSNAGSQFLGLALDHSVIGERTPVRYAGVVYLQTPEWDIITGNVGGLTKGPYYLDTNAGKLTTSKPESDVILVGYALSANALFITPTRNGRLG